MSDSVELLEQKRKFAIALLKNPNNTFACAKEVFGDDSGAALQVHTVWPRDGTVLDFQQEYVETHGGLSVLPEKDKFARDVYDLAQGEKDPDIRLRAFKLYGDIMGYIEKPGTQVNIQNNTTNKVMKIIDHGNVDEWAAKLDVQQSRLVSENA